MNEKQAFSDNPSAIAPYLPELNAPSPLNPPPYEAALQPAPGNYIYAPQPAQAPYYQQQPGATQPPFAAQPAASQQQQHPYPPAPVNVTNTFVVQQRLGRSPMAQTCPNCQHQVVTQITFEAGLLLWMIVGGIILFGGWVFCLCFIPFCINDLKDVHHTCPNCKYKQISKAG